MLSDAEATARLDEVLRGYGLSLAELSEEVEATYGEPELVLASGSLMAGFGSPKSDIDLLVIMDAKRRVTDLPIMSYRKDAHIDTEYYARDAVLEMCEVLDRPDVLRATMSEKGWRKDYRLLRTLTRFGHSSILEATETWRAIIDRLRSATFFDVVAAWWRAEAVRYHIGASWLAPANPLLACLRMQEAIQASLSARAAARGELILPKKWLAGKLDACGDDAGLTELRTLLSLDPTGDPACAFDTLKARSLDHIGDEARRYPLELHLASGVELIDLKTETLASRWGLRAIHFRPTRDGLRGADKRSTPVWAGAGDQTPPDFGLDLFRADMAWLGIGNRVAEDRP